MQGKNVVKHAHKVSKDDRIQLNKNKPFVLWFTGLSGSGKSTLASEIEYKLLQAEVRTMILDGDNVRMGLNKDLGFSAADRSENIRRIAEVAKLLTEAGIVTLVCFISPFQADRKKARDLFLDGEFIEIFVKCDLEACKQRDPKGLYQKALAGEIENFTGISSPYEPPHTPEIVVETDTQSVDELAHHVISYLKQNGYIG